MITITAGMIKTFEDCPEKYDLIYNRKLEIPTENNTSETGKKLHALINYYLKGQDISRIIDSVEKSKNTELKNLWSNFSKLNISKSEESEFTFNIPFSKNIKIMGRIDAVKKTTNGYEILDWKTGKSSNINVENDWQTKIYLFGLYNLFKYYNKISFHKELSMTYCFLKENSNKTVNFSKEQFEQIQKEITMISNKILSYDKKKTKVSSKCKNCSFNIVCEKDYSI